MHHSPPYFPASDAGLSLDGFAALSDERRPFPTEDALQQLGHAVMTELLDLVLGSALEDHAAAIAESLIGGLHTAVLRLERSADKNRDALARGLREFDGSEVADYDLQQVRASTDAADAAVCAAAAIRDAAAETYGAATGETWSPWRGGVRPSGITAGQVDAAQALRARDALRLTQASAGDQVVVFRGAPDAASALDAGRIYDALNWAKATWPQMTLALSGARGAEHIAKRWAARSRVRLVLSRPDFERHGRAAPFRANDALMALTPVCVLALSKSLEDGPQGPSKPFGPVLNMVEQAQRAGVRFVRISAKACGSP
jgi:hypothetical protein